MKKHNHNLILLLFIMAGLYSSFIPVLADSEKGSIILKINEPRNNRSFVAYQIQNKDGSYTGPFSALNVDDAGDPDAISAYIQRKKQNEFLTVMHKFTNEDVINDLEKGRYLITQTDAPEGYEKISPFLVDIPLMIEDGSAKYIVTCYPKAKRIMSTIKNSRSCCQPDSIAFYGIGAILIGIGIIAMVI